MLCFASVREREGKAIRAERSPRQKRLQFNGGSRVDESSGPVSYHSRSRGAMCGTDASPCFVCTRPLLLIPNGRTAPANPEICVLCICTLVRMGLRISSWTPSPLARPAILPCVTPLSFGAMRVENPAFNCPRLLRSWNPHPHLNGSSVCTPTPPLVPVCSSHVSLPKYLAWEMAILNTLLDYALSTLL